ncbi:hypothetical protein IQ268_19995 [Oculatella sp. LEGE 06141]|uniref:hypothetical protein n=1 Tax=Oculatella sp. LEGE 06141 TaxID=1828648 RepID=UPI0018809399|nr:hypothetical protein [Oculatella sp. LEGE 06141]MBE9180847.1 hypothetical protein [Oculatella sp. LEGE 06141]
MLKTVRKTFINLSTSWRLFGESTNTDTSSQPVCRIDQLEEKIKEAHDALIGSLLNRNFRFYLKHDPAVHTSFIVGRYVGADSKTEVPEISMTAYASANGYNGMLLKTVKPGKVDFIQYSVPTASEIATTIANYLNLLE